MLTTEEDEETISKISMLSGVTVNNVKKVFKALDTEVVFQYSVDNKRITLPYLGNIMIRYEGDEETAKGKVANLDVMFSPHPQLKQLVGQLVDIDAGKLSATQLSTYKFLMKIMRLDLKTKIDE